MESGGAFSSNPIRPLKSTVKRGKGLPRKAQGLSKEELLLTLKKKAECNAKALKIVEGMLEPNVREDWFLEVLRDINQSHLQDVIEERAIVKLCAYPLCSNELKNIPSQQYRISTKLNKVYDIKERKNFCSNRCFKACKFIKDQMHTSPLWLRDIEPAVKFVLLPLSESGGGAGDEVQVQIERVSKEEVKILSDHDDSHCNTESASPDGVSAERSLPDLLESMDLVTTLRRKDVVPKYLDKGISEAVSVVCNQEAFEAGILDRPQETILTNSERKECNKNTTVNGLEQGVIDFHKVVDAAPISEGRREKNRLSSSIPKTYDSFHVVSGEVAHDKLTKNESGLVQNDVSECKDSGIVQLNLQRDLTSQEPSEAFSIASIDSLLTGITTNKDDQSQNLNEEKVPSFNQNEKSDLMSKTQSSVNVEQKPTGVSIKLEVPENAISTENKLNVLPNSRNSEGNKLASVSNAPHFVHQASKGAKRKSKTVCGLPGNNREQRSVEPDSLDKRQLSIVSHVEKCIQEWFTMETMYFLLGENALKDLLEQKGESIKEHYKGLSSITWDQEKHERFLTICKRLNIMELEDSSYDKQMIRNENDPQRKPLPDYEALKQEAETMELKVKAFYKGKLEADARKVSFAEDVKQDSADKDENKEPQLPLVHLHSQRALRKKIVLEGLNRVLPDFLRTFGIRPSELSSAIRGLTSTFALSSTNITFKPQEWSLLGLIVIKLLTLREVELKRCLEQEQSSTYLTLMLMSYKQEPGYLDRLLSWLTDIDMLLSKSSTPLEAHNVT